MSMIFGFSIKNWLKISHYIFDLANTAGQCNQSLLLLLLLSLLLLLLSPLEFFTSVLADGFSLEFE